MSGAPSYRACRIMQSLLTTIQFPFCMLPADDLEVTGIVRAQWRPLFPGARCDGTLTLHACHMRTVNSLHRAVAPPPEGLAEQFRCAACSMAFAHPLT